jgi:hypothetical protein
MKFVSDITVPYAEFDEVIEDGLKKKFIDFI